MTQKRATSVPQGRIGRPVVAEGNRGQYERALRASNKKVFDEALGDLLGIGPPERPPPRVSKQD